jgi:molybdate transport system ATP-binding protein
MNVRFAGLRLKLGSFVIAVDLETAGETIGIFGNSGAGKTSLLEMVAGLRKPASGRIEIDGRVLSDRAEGIFLPPEQRAVGYVPQDLALFPHLSVRRNIEYGRSARAEPSPLNFDHVVEVLEIGAFLDRSPARLSGGQKQRVAFARALLAHPRLLLMDEPLASLDHDLKLRIIPYLQRIRDEFKIPMLYVSHDPDEVVALCDRVVVMEGGACVRVSAPGEIFEQAESMVLRKGILGGN